MSIVGIALRGFGRALGKKVKNTAKKKFDARREAFGNAAFKNDIGQTVGKAKKLHKAIKKATTRTEKQIEMLQGKIGLKKD